MSSSAASSSFNENFYAKIEAESEARDFDILILFTTFFQSMEWFGLIVKAFARNFSIKLRQ